MKLGTYLFLLAIVLALAAGFPAGAYGAATSRSAKLERLQDWEERVGGPIDMSSEHEAFDSLVLNGPRDYTLILVITSGTERFPCPVCLPFDASFSHVAKIHSTMANKSDTLFFVRVDAGLLRRDQLQTISGKVTTIPFVVKLTPTKLKGLRFDVEDKNIWKTSSHDDIGLAIWVNSQTDVHIRVINYQRIAVITTAILCVAAALYLRFDFFWSVAHNPMIYFTASMVGYCVVVGGTVFNFIHRVPFFGYDGQTVHWILPGAREQVGAEGVVMATLVGSTSFGFIALAHLLPASGRPKRYTLLAIGLIFILMLVTRRLFLMKHPYYPY